MPNNWQQTKQDTPWCEPIEAYQRLRSLQPLMLDGMGAHPEARYAVIALAPRFELRCVDGAWQRDDLLGKTTAMPGPVLETLQAALDEWRLDVPTGPAFQGGFIGYFGYEFTKHIEPTLQFHRAETPDAVLRLCTDAMVFDRQEGKAWLVAHDNEGKGEARLAMYQALLAMDSPPRVPVPTLHWTPVMAQPDFERHVVRLRAHILNGDLFQANLATRFDADTDADPVSFYQQFAANNPSPYMALMEFDDHAIVSCSPEQLLAVQDRVARTRPIAGTRPRGTTDGEDEANEQELLTDEKERAEHTMLVDLLRNDMAKLAEPGSTHVAESMSVERYQKVMHLVSRVQSTVRKGTRAVDWIAALFPGGTITGAPKHRACMRIHEAEDVARGPYTGSAGSIDFAHNVHLNILIRTLVLKDGRASVHAGSGIVADSEPTREWLEAGNKAAALLGENPPATRLGEVTAHGAWQPPKPQRTVAARVLLVDNYDSFVHNLADYCAMHGADVSVVRNDVRLEQAMAFQPTHVILGPGPGWPNESGITQDLAATLAVPTLGVCLGHQAMAQAHGGRVFVAPTVHGKTSPIQHDGTGLFADMPSPFTATRYHSLIVDPPADWCVTARLEDGTVMAMQHPEKPAWGVQFHPESFCTEFGLDLIGRFLDV